MLRHYIPIRLISAPLVLRDKAVDRLQQLGAVVARDTIGMLAIEPAAEVAANDHAARVAWQAAEVGGEAVEARSVAHEILLDVRRVERRDFLAALGDQLSDRRQRVIARKVADDRDDEM